MTGDSSPNTYEIVLLLEVALDAGDNRFDCAWFGVVRVVMRSILAGHVPRGGAAPWLEAPDCDAPA